MAALSGRPPRPQPARRFAALGIVMLAVGMGGLALAKIGYNQYLKFVWPFLAAVFVVVCAFVGIAAAVG